VERFRWERFRWERLRWERFRWERFRWERFRWERFRWERIEQRGMMVTLGVLRCAQNDGKKLIAAKTYLSEDK
jgi:hypothetical protein